MIEINRLKHPYTNKERLRFIVENNHKNGYLIQEDSKTGDLIALAKDEDELSKIDKENIAHLNMTRLDFVNCLEKLGISWAALKALMAANPEVEKQLEMCSNVWRGNPLLDAMLPLVNQTLSLNITSDDLDKVFIQTCHYERLVKEGESENAVQGKEREEVINPE